MYCTAKHATHPAYIQRVGKKKESPMKIVIVSIIIKLWRDGSPKDVAIYSDIVLFKLNNCVK